MKTIVALFVGGLLLSPSVYAKESTKQPVKVNTFDISFEQQLDKTNQAMLEYSATDCTAPEFSVAVENFVRETNALSNLIQNIPDGLADLVRIKIVEEGTGALYFAQKFVADQNECIDTHKSDPHLKLGTERGD